jgi:hypothetical protein
MPGVSLSNCRASASLWKLTCFCILESTDIYIWSSSARWQLHCHGQYFLSNPRSHPVLYLHVFFLAGFVLLLSLNSFLLLLFPGGFRHAFRDTPVCCVTHQKQHEDYEENLDLEKSPW